MRKLDTGLGAVQWFAFILANSLAFPIIIGEAFDLSAAEVASMMQRTFFVVGIGSLLSLWLGHRFPILDGPAGVWISVFVVTAEIALKAGQAADTTLQLLEGAMLLSGLVLVLLSVFGLMKYILKLFTPLVTGISLMILGIQLSGTLINGMIGSGDVSTAASKWNIVLAFFVFVLVLALSTWGEGWLKSYAVLIGIVIGWAAFVLLNGTDTDFRIDSIVTVPQPFAWGIPRLDPGMAVTAMIVCIVLICNVIATVTAMIQVFGEREGNFDGFSVKNRGNVTRTTLMNGISNMLSGVFSTVGAVPISVSASFVKMTGQYRKKPFMIACIAIVAVSCLPFIYAVLSTLPGQIAYAVLLPTFTQLIGIGMKTVLKIPFDQRRLTIFSIALSLGAGVMFLPEDLMAELPTIMQYIIGNGLMVGTLITLVLEQVWREDRLESDTN